MTDRASASPAWRFCVEVNRVRRSKITATRLSELIKEADAEGLIEWLRPEEGSPAQAFGRVETWKGFAFFIITPRFNIKPSPWYILRIASPHVDGPIPKERFIDISPREWDAWQYFDKLFQDKGIPANWQEKLPLEASAS